MDQNIKKAKELGDKVQRDAGELAKTIPDKSLADKVRKLGEQAGEVSKHVTERTDPKSG